MKYNSFDINFRRNSICSEDRIGSISRYLDLDLQGKDIQSRKHDQENLLFYGLHCIEWIEIFDNYFFSLTLSFLLKDLSLLKPVVVTGPLKNNLLMESMLNISESDMIEIDSLFEQLLEAQGFTDSKNFSREDFLLIRSSDGEGYYYHTKEHVS